MARLTRKPWTAIQSLIITLVLGAALAGCGGGDGDPTATPTQATAIPAPAITSTKVPAAGSGLSLDRYDYGRTGSFTGAAPSGEPVIRWKAKVGNDIDVAPVVADGIVYAVGSDLHAFDVSSGDERWEASIDAESAPAVSNGVLYIGGQAKGKPALFAFDAATGEELWRIGFDCTSWKGDKFCNVGTAPAIVNGLVIAGTPGDLVAVDAATGAEKWRVDEDGIFGTPLIAGEVVIASAHDRVYALDVRSGEQIWNTEAGERSYAFMISRELVFVRAPEGKLTALDLATGREAWTAKLDGNLTDGAAFGDLLIIGTANENRLLGIDAATGVERWRVELDQAIYAPASIAAGIAIYGSGGYVVAVDGATGTRLWRVKIGDVITAPVAIAGGIVYAGSHNDQLFALGPG